MKLIAEQQKQISHMLSTELQCADEMRSILEQENGALLNGEPEKILSIIEAKQVTKSKMQKLLLHRDRFLKALSLPSGNQGTQKLIDQLPGSQAEQLWKKLTIQAIQLKEINEVNGGIVNLSLKHNQLALGILTGQSPETDTYGPGGQSRKGAFHQTLAKV